MTVADLMEAMAAAGAPMAAIVLAVRALEEKDALIEARRAGDRERKRRQRGTVTGQSRDTDVTVTDTPPSLDKETSPRPPKEIKPIPELSEAEASSPALQPEHVVEAWNDMAGRCGLPKAKLTPPRRRALTSRIRQHTISDFTEAIGAVERSPFLLGENDRAWRADFDFLLQPKSFIRLIEGSYDRGK